MPRRNLVFFLCIFVLILPAVAQETRGTIVGRVTDASGSYVPGATVQVLNKAMGTKVTLQTNQDGIYTAPLLLPGTYEVTVSATGFKSSVRDNVELRIADRIEVNLALEVGGAEQSITVEGG